jgi:hypothetical protein
MAISTDGIHFTKQPKPILAPGNDAFKSFEWPGGIEDPRVIETGDGQFLLTYTSYDGKTARLCSAISKDLVNWEKLGPMLASPKYINLWSKSGAIVGKEINSRIIAEKIDGYYWMYFGDTDLFMAKSKDLRTWEVCENAENQNRISVLHPRMGYFDSRLVEPGPYALLRNEGILLIYNSSNAANFNEPNFPKFTYAAGQSGIHLARQRLRTRRGSERGLLRGRTRPFSRQLVFILRYSGFENRGSGQKVATRYHASKNNVETRYFASKLIKDAKYCVSTKTKRTTDYRTNKKEKL